jgi:hypothetical protein
LKIKVECSSPKYVKGNYEYQRFEEVYNLLVRIKGFPKGYVGQWLLNLAKDGSIDGVYTARYGLKIKSDFHDYTLAQKVAKESGLLKSFDKVSPRLDIALAFAKSFDKEAFSQKRGELRD